MAVKGVYRGIPEREGSVGGGMEKGMELGVLPSGARN